MLVWIWFWIRIPNTASKSGFSTQAFNTAFLYSTTLIRSKPPLSVWNLIKIKESVVNVLKQYLPYKASFGVLYIVSKYPSLGYQLHEVNNYGGCA
jgi:hypothetical protein